jgi:uncharacterized OB-fold protein
MSQQDHPSESVPESGLTYVEWAAALRDGTLLGIECTNCGAVVATPKSVCPRCHTDDVGPVDLPTTGEVYVETTIAVAQDAFDGPYQIAVVDLGETRIMARIDGEVAIGDTVTFTDVLEMKDKPVPVFE